MLQVMLVLMGALGALGASSAAGNGTRHAFYRKMGARKSGESRRVFGGAAVPLSSFPSTCVLMDRYWTARCTAAVVAPHWAVTAAHCVSPRVAYVKYNTRLPSSEPGGVAAVIYMYSHPGFRVVEEDEGRGLDVTQLYHDVGLVRTRSSMQLHPPLVQQPVTAMSAMTQYDLETLRNERVKVLGFGSTERSGQGEELFEVQLRLVACERVSWKYCECGVGEALSGPGSRGVCVGDSGGPVVYRGAQVGVTSMGPMQCGEGRSEPSEGATSVFTALYPYVQMLNSTIHETEWVLRMRRINAGESDSASGLSYSAAAALVVPAAAAFFVRRAR